MRARGEDRRDEQKVGPGAPSRERFRPIMRRPASQPTAPPRLMHAIPRQTTSGHQQNQPPRLSDSPDPAVNRTPLGRGRRVVTEHHPRSGWQPGQRGPKPLP